MKWTRLIVYALLIVLAIGFLVPLGVVIANSLRSNQEIAASSLIAWPAHLTFANFPQAWNKFCMAEHCWGIQPYMLNSLTLTIPATFSRRCWAHLPVIRSRCGASAATSSCSASSRLASSCPSR